jgi:hypothetical protein
LHTFCFFLRVGGQKGHADVPVTLPKHNPISFLLSLPFTGLASWPIYFSPLSDFDLTIHNASTAFFMDMAMDAGLVFNKCPRHELE